MTRFRQLAIRDPDELLFGVAPHPLTTRSGMVIGGGTVYPEINFTLPPILVSRESFAEVRDQYRQIITGILARAAELEAPGVVVEFETVPDMTSRPEWAVELTGVLLEGMARAKDATGLASVLRVTPNDNREMVRPPLMRSGRHWRDMIETFDACAAAGAELLSIESVGGKEVHDEALVMADIRQAIFALCVMGVRDMNFLWSRIAEIASAHGARAAGDTACGFANTAMVLAEKKMIPKVFAAVDRALSAVRSLVAYECGAVGPGKDCAYENVILKAITGHPTSLVGKTAACAHLSPLGNLTMGMCDLWSNESVQNTKMLGGMAPTVYMEQLIYDCRLLNRAAAGGAAGRLTLRDWLVASDAPLDPQAFILAPENAVALAETIVAEPNHYRAGKAVVLKAAELLRDAHRAGALRIEDRELPWLDGIISTVRAMPDDEAQFIRQMMREVDTGRFVAADYELLSA